MAGGGSRCAVPDSRGRREEPSPRAAPGQMGASGRGATVRARVAVPAGGRRRGSPPRHEGGQPQRHVLLVVHVADERAARGAAAACVTATGGPSLATARSRTSHDPVVPPANVVVVRTCTQLDRSACRPCTPRGRRRGRRPRSWPSPVVQPTVNIEPVSSPAGRNGVFTHAIRRLVADPEEGVPLVPDPLRPAARADADAPDRGAARSARPSAAGRRRGRR